MTIVVPGERSARSAEEILRSIQSRHPYPLSAQLALTHRCNLECPHCSQASNRRNGDELAIDDYVRLFEELAALGVLKLTLTGGEATLRDDLPQIIEAASNRRFWSRLKTNGAALSSAYADICLNAGLTAVDVSLYDADALGHDTFVGQKGAYENATRFADRFQTQGGEVRITVMAMNWNISRIPDLIGMCESHDFEYSVDAMVAPRTNGSLVPTALRADEEQLVALMRWQYEKDPTRMPNHRPRQCGDTVCGAGRQSVQIQPNGDVLACERLPIVLGNLRHLSFEAIWDAAPFRQKLRNARWGQLRQCASCGDAWACSRCPGAALLERGDLFGTIPFECTITRARILAISAMDNAFRPLSAGRVVDGQPVSHS